ncbi:hypothetical protein GCG54_00008564 [Colletotrichum gloeosporioides]|uniref:Uncharacterized protein n=1 Tax=Colletotrichum gloeosporioides TaxID=474922 RepID=A0A8H4FD30_COLGL|nr:uncharacterized protein GCG54_00008564 [Colletotrichum gloeosporioides]KAF3797570.1 hypothetical protein GCG54_00008564 [Colletotrichum gloeosporioides]
MRYQVGRACAVAGYNKLFDQLQLLLDVSIAEEAEDSNNAYIRDAIISKPVRYAVMNDYARTIDIDKARAGACLNGDTAVRSSLEKKRRHGHDTEEYITLITSTSKRTATYALSIGEALSIRFYKASMRT